MKNKQLGLINKINNSLKNIKHFKLKIFSIFMLMTLISLQFTPFMLRATATQLPFHSPSLITPATDIYYQKNVFFSNATLGGDTAYCIDYGKSLPTGTLSYYKQLSAQGVAILVYGYPHTSASEMGCASDDEAYMATQMAFWTVMAKTGESEAVRVFNLDNVYAKPGYEDFMERAAAAAKKLNARAIADPYIPNPSLTINTDSAKLVNRDGTILTGPYVVNVTGGTVSSITASLDNAPSSAKVVDVNGNAKTTFSNGESLYVAVDERENGGEMTLKVLGDTNKVVGSIYSGGEASQNFVKLDTVPVELIASVNIRWGTQIGSIELHKVDQDDNAISGVKFELRDMENKKIAEGTTGGDGYIRFSNVKVGEYRLVEISAPSGYIMSTDSSKVTVKTGETSRVKFVNEKIKGALEITKVDEKNTPIPNVTFELLNSNKEKLVEMTTNEEGRTKVNNLSAGTYYYREISAPVNVIMDKTLREFKIESTNQLVTKKITNKKITGGLKIIKSDELGTPISGVRFQILNSNKSVVNTITTDDKGVATLENLSAGTYYYKEVSGPSNIIIDTNEYPFNINSASDVVSKEIVNKYKKAKLQIVKNNNLNNPIANVKFQILDSNKNVVDTITTNDNGVATSKDLILGTYYYKEVEAPANVVMDSTEHEFILEQDKQVLTKTVINEMVKEKLKIVKVDEEQRPISGVKFQILDSNKNVIEEIITGSDGIAFSSDLSVGTTYYYKEVSGPSNVLIDSNEYAFRVTENSGVITKKMVNRYKRASLKIQKTDEDSRPISGVKFQILDAGKNVVETITTGSDGVANTSNLKLGTYYYKEIEAPDYLIIDTNEYEFILSNDEQVLTKTIVNETIYGNLQIVKVDEEKMPIKGVVFEILDENKNLVDTITTDENGIATSKNLTIGKYYYREKSVDSKYVLDNNEYIFRINENNQVITKKVINKKIKGSLKIIKTDSVNRPLSGVSFEILNQDKEVVETLTTGSDGIAVSSDLLKGKYYYREVSAPDGVIVDNTEYIFAITSDAQVIQKKIVNKYSQKGTLEITKTDEYGEKLSGIKFDILDSNKNLIETIITNEEGIANSSELALGTYYYKEVEAPINIILDTNEYEFKITENNQIVRKNVVNEYEKRSLKIIKVDENDVPLEGIEFNILDSSKNVIDTIVTDKDGIATSKELVEGSYYYQETKVPDNIILDNSLHEFTVSKNDEIVIKNMINYYKKGNIKIKKIDEDGNLIRGVKFNILDKNSEIIETITTGEDGIATSRKLVYGTYYYQEIEVPQGLILDDKLNEFNISENNKTLEFTMENKYVKGSLKIIKVDKSNIPISNVKFDILDSNKNLVKRVTTGSDGQVTVHDLKLGKYYYKEVEVPNNYSLDENEYEFEVENYAQQITKTVVNEYATGVLKIIKVDENDVPLEGIKFNILDSDKNIVESIVTNSAGIAESSELRVGTYYYQEIEAPEHIIIDTGIYEFKVTKDKEVVIKNLVNKYEGSTLKIIKVDENKVPLQGIKFNILDENKKVIDTIITNKDGIAESRELTLGTYYYQEISVPNGIALDNTVYEFNVTEHGQVVIKNMINYFSKGNLKIIKVDTEDKPVSLVKFKIFNSNKEEIEEIITNEEGIAESSKLPLGKYFYKEVEAPSGFVIDDKLYQFNITENLQVITKKMVNKEVYGTFKIIKINKDTKEKLKGVEFKIFNSKREEIGSYTTDENGNISVENLPYGKYYYKEVKTPDGYLIDTNEYEFDIKKDNVVITRTITNEKEKLPVTGGIISSNMIIVTIVTIVSIVGYVIFNILRDKKEDGNFKFKDDDFVDEKDYDD